MRALLNDDGSCWLMMGASDWSPSSLSAGSGRAGFKGETWVIQLLCWGFRTFPCPCHRGCTVCCGGFGSNLRVGLEHLKSEGEKWWWRENVYSFTFQTKGIDLFGLFLKSRSILKTLWLWLGLLTADWSSQCDSRSGWRSFSGSSTSAVKLKPTRHLCLHRRAQL